MEQMRQILHATHDIAGSIWYGGNVFGIMATNPAVKEISNRSDRGAVVNQAWENFIPWGLGSALAFGATYAALRFDDPRFDRPEFKNLTTIRDAAAASIVVLTLVGGVLNRITAESVPADRTPMEDGLTPSEEAPEEAKQSTIGLRLVAIGNLVAGTTYFVATALQEQALMDQGPLGRAMLPFQRAGRIGGVAFETAKTAAAIELVRRGAKMVGDGVGITKPEPRNRLQKFGDRVSEHASNLTSAFGK